MADDNAYKPDEKVEDKTYEKPVFDRNKMALDYGPSYGIPRNEGETPDQYRERLSYELRAKGQVIEAHEIMTGRRYDDPEQDKDFGPMTGIIGAVAMVLGGVNFGSERRVDDESVYGFMVRQGPDKSSEYIGRVFDMMGPGAGMDFLDASRRINSFDPNPIRSTEDNKKDYRIATSETLALAKPKTRASKKKKK